MSSKPAVLALSSLVGVVIVLGPSRVMASAEFPATLQSAWGISRLPSAAGADGCLLCHATVAGGVVGTPFGRTVDARGVGKKDPSGLVRALSAIKSAGTDSDKDDISDFLELSRDRTNPNDPDDFKIPEPPQGEGGQGGAAGAEGGAGLNGTGGEFIDPGPENPSFPTLPRLPEHGCRFARPATFSFLGITLVLLAGLSLVARRRSSTGSSLNRHERATRWN